jgi:hypothetical protein
MWSRDESGAETFRLFRGKIEMEWKYENGNGILRNGNGNSLAEVETETKQHFPVEQTRKQKFPFPTNMEFPFMVVLMDNLAGPICDLVILNRQSNPSPTPPLHRVIVTGLGHMVFDLLDFLEFFCMIQVVSWFRQSSVFRPRPHHIRSISVSGSICFHICFRCFRIHFCFRIKIWKQMW